MSLSAFCHKAVSGDAALLTRFTPYVTKPDDVKQILGEPTRINRGKEHIIWTYEGHGLNMSFIWDLRVVRLQEFNYRNADKTAKELDPASLCKLRTGTTVPGDALDALGAPRDLFADINDQKMVYEFSAHVVRLYFHDGKLLHYEVNGLEKRKS